MKTGILYIDDEQGCLLAFKALFNADYQIYTALSSREGYSLLETHHQEIHLIITDQRMPEITGIEFLSSIISKYPDQIRILLSDYTDIKTVIDAINIGQIYKYMPKPWNEEELKKTIEKAFELFNTKKLAIKKIKDLTKANEQLEFLVRQRLLS